MTDWEEALNIISEYLEENAKRPEVAYLCKDKGTEYCHHTTHIEQARNFEKVGPNQWMEKEPKRGEWKCNRDDLELICSVCGEALPFSDEYDYETNFCPNCGADMREGR